MSWHTIITGQLGLVDDLHPHEHRRHQALDIDLLVRVECGEDTILQTVISKPLESGVLDVWFALAGQVMEAAGNDPVRRQPHGPYAAP